ncbi:MAG: outer membrane protein assembly factor BamA [bacterium]|nr:outer membrane protein assembly factor BamA [bacterium]
MRVLLLLFFICNTLCAKRVFCDAEHSQIAKAFRINQVSFTGNGFLSQKTITQKIKYTVEEIYDWSELIANKDELIKLYQKFGFFEVDIVVNPVLVAKVNDEFIYDIEFRIIENNRSLIRKINFFGNDRVKLQQIKNVLAANFLVSPSDRGGYGYFDQDRVDSYCTQILTLYLSLGFLDAEVNLSKVIIDPDFNEVNITFAINEGDFYQLGNLSFSGELENYHFDINNVSIKQGHILNLTVLQKEVDLLLNPYREDGYIFTVAIPRVQIIKIADEKSDFGIVSVNYEIQKGARVKINQFLVEGNSKTSNKVILNKVIIDADKLCRLSVLQKLQQNLVELGYFKTVDIILQPTNIANEVDVLIKVEEHPTWFFSIAPVLSSETGFVFAAMIAERNWLGLGLFISLKTELSNLSKTFNFTLVEPNLFSTNQSVLFEMFRNKVKYPSFAVRNYGVNFNYSVPLNNYFSVGLDWQLANVNVDNSRIDLLERNQVFWPNNNFKNALAVFTQAHLVRKAFGIKSKIKVNYSGKFIRSQLNFFELVFNANAYSLIANKVKIKASVSTGQLFTVCQNLLPISERYYLGGQGSVRGFLPHSLGPMIGGTFKYEQTVEVEFPVWPRYELQGYLFVDAGNAFLSATNFNILQLYWSVGAGLVLPVFGFPMNLELSVPLVKSGHNKSFDLFLGFKSEW